MSDFLIRVAATFFVLMTKLIILSVFLASVIYGTTIMLEFMGYFQ